MTRTSRIGPRLYQGIAPPTGPALKNLGWDVLVLCAEEFQPSASEFPGLEVIHAPNDDADREPTTDELAIVMSRALLVAMRVREGKRVLVTCRLGMNRSGLVSATALHFLTGAGGEACVKRVRDARPGALSNPHFVRVLRRKLVRDRSSAAVYL